jgi:hypothetical protein
LAPAGAEHLRAHTWYDLIGVARVFICLRAASGEEVIFFP